MNNRILLSALPLLLLIPGGREAAAQTLFQWPDSKLAIENYSYIDNCIALHSRVTDSVSAREVDIQDTVSSPRAAPSMRGNDRRPKVIESMTECLARFGPADVPREYTILAHQAFLNAGRYEDAEAIVRRGVSSIKDNDTAASYLLDSAVLQYTKFTPFQLEATSAYMQDLEGYGSVYRDFYKVRAYLWILLAAYHAEEDELATKAAHRVLEVAPEAVKETSQGETFAVSIAVGHALRLLHGAELIDSLRTSTQAYANLFSSHLKQTIGFVPQTIMAGSDAPLLNGDFWYPSSASSEEYPAQGKLSMVVFIPSTSNMVRNVGDLANLAVIRRLAERYPDIQVVFSSSTVGFFGPLEPPDSDREARMIDSLMRVHYGIKNVLTVTRGNFIQLDEPDSRRVYQSYRNIDEYPIRGQGGGKLLQIYLIDENRKIVDRVTPDLQGENWAIKLIDALRERNGTTLTAGRYNK